MLRRLLTKSLIAIALAIACDDTRAQEQPTAPAAEPFCDAVCRLGQALNKKDTPIRSESGTGAGVVTKVPLDKQTDYKPLDSTPGPRSNTK